MRRKPITAAEFAAELANNEEYQRCLREDEEKRLAAAAEFRREEAGLVAELVETGMKIVINAIPGEEYSGPPKSISDLVNTQSRYPEAIPVLMKHLQLDYSRPIKESIVRALITPDAIGSAGVLIQMFEAAATDSDFKFIIGCAIAESATENDAMKIIELANDPSHSHGREFLPLGLVCCKQDALPTLENWQNDPILGANARKAIKLIRRRYRS